MPWIRNHFSQYNYSIQRRTLWVDNPSEIGGRIYDQFTAFREWRLLVPVETLSFLWGTTASHYFQYILFYEITYTFLAVAWRHKAATCGKFDTFLFSSSIHASIKITHLSKLRRLVQKISGVIDFKSRSPKLHLYLIFHQLFVVRKLFHLKQT